MINIYDRIKEISYTIGTSNIALGGAVKGFSTFSSVYSNNDKLFYAITDGTNYEIGSGIYLSSNQIIRFPVKTTNSNNLVNFPEGLKEIYVNYPATNAVFNTSGLSPVPQNSGLTFWTSSNSLSYSDKFIVDSGNGRIGINKSNPTASIDIGGSSPLSNIKASGFIVGNSGIYFPSGNNGLSSYSGGVQLTHFEMNQTDTYSASVIQLSGIVNQNILLKKQNAGTVFAGPPGNCSPPCNPAYPSFRPLIIEDIPDLSSLYTANFLNIICGRISLNSTNPVADGTSNSIHFVPYNGNLISVYDGSKWVTTKFTSKLIANFSSLSGNTMYDVFGYIDQNKELNFELQSWIMPDLLWEEHGLPEPIELSRSISLTKVDGIFCKSNNTSRRYIGTIRTTSSGFADNSTKRFINNCNNKVEKTLLSYPTVNSWVYNSTNYRIIPYIPKIEVISGELDDDKTFAELRFISFLNKFLSSNNSYFSFIFPHQVSFDDISSFDIVDLINTSSPLDSYEIGYSNYYKASYADEIGQTLVSYIKCIPYAHTQFVALERSMLDQIYISCNTNYGKYGIMGTYLC